MQQNNHRLDLLRTRLIHLGLSGFLIPRNDQFQGEYVPDSAQRLGWVTGFTGSAGLAVLLRDQTALFVDGRYTLQARQQVDLDRITPLHSSEMPVTRWLKKALVAGDRLGFDPWLHTDQQIAEWDEICHDAGAELVPCYDNPIDQIWADRPAPPQSAVVLYPESLAGASAYGKRQQVADDLAAANADALILTDPTSVAWLLNIRADDVPHLPVPLCFAILYKSAMVQLFVDAHRVSASVRAALGPDVQIHAPDRFSEVLWSLGQQGLVVQQNPAHAAHAIGNCLRQGGAQLIAGTDPCALPKGRKNAAEIAGSQAAHRRDAVAMIGFLSWFSRQAHAAATGGDSGSDEALSEMHCAAMIESLRRRDSECRDLSFPTIAGAGPNSAVIHYQATPQTNRLLQRGDIFLLDSGGQYWGGTTDITRTLCFGTPTAQQRRHYTLVLKGHIALAQAVFPSGTTGPQLDCLARQFLWQAGLDYDHGTGHGVGSYLSVHEGPHRISKQGDRAVALEAGMILSNEPGYYRSGEYGIRLENLLLVIELERPAGGERSLLGFETLTLVPFDWAMIDATLLNESERRWLTDYHQRILETIGPHLSPEDRQWCDTYCRIHQP